MEGYLGEVEEKSPRCIDLGYVGKRQYDLSPVICSFGMLARVSFQVDSLQIRKGTKLGLEAL